MLGLAAAVLLAAPARADTLAARLAPPAGYQRVAVATGSFGAWLRELPLKPGRPDVTLFNGRPKGRQDVHEAVLDLDVGGRDLQQCADAVMRLRAEWLWSAGRWKEIAFDATSGERVSYARWREGGRPRARGRRIVWDQVDEQDLSYRGMRRYLDFVFMYAGSASLSRELRRVAKAADLEPGDVFIQGGYPGHAVLVADVAVSAAGDKVFLLAQSYMPAQDIHVLRDFAEPGLSPWFRAEEGKPLETPEWTFPSGSLRRF